MTELDSPYALLCISRSPCDNSSDKQAYGRNINWPSEVKKALATGTNTEHHVIIDNTSRLAVVVNDIRLTKTNQLTRIVRNHLMRNDPNSNISMAVAQVDNDQIDVDNLLMEICTNLNRNIEEGSSRIKVKHYKA